MGGPPDGGGWSGDIGQYGVRMDRVARAGVAGGLGLVTFRISLSVMREDAGGAVTAIVLGVIVVLVMWTLTAARKAG